MQSEIIASGIRLEATKTRFHCVTPCRWPTLQAARLSRVPWPCALRPVLTSRIQRRTRWWPWTLSSQWFARRRAFLRQRNSGTEMANAFATSYNRECWTLCAINYRTGQQVRLHWKSRRWVVSRYALANWNGHTLCPSVGWVLILPMFNEAE